MLPIILLADNSCDTGIARYLIPDIYRGLRDPNQGCKALLPFNSLDVIKQLLLNGIQIALSLASILAIAFIIVGSIQYITSQGSPEKIKQAKATIVNSLIGLALAITAFLIVSAIANSFGGSA